jgi:Domain of unknown function (DUF1772)
MQASLAIMGGFFGLLAYLSTLDWRWLLGAIVLLANWPYTLFVIAPTNNRLINTPSEAATAETRRMLEQWGALHAGRSVLGLVATLIFLWLSGELPMVEGIDEPPAVMSPDNITGSRGGAHAQVLRVYGFRQPSRYRESSPQE